MHAALALGGKPRTPRKGDCPPISWWQIQRFELVPSRCELCSRQSGQWAIDHHHISYTVVFLLGYIR